MADCAREKEKGGNPYTHKLRLLFVQSTLDTNAKHPRQQRVVVILQGLNVLSAVVNNITAISTQN